MNDKIRQLALQAGQGEPFHIPPEFVEKFARLIVKECVGICNQAILQNQDTLSKLGVDELAEQMIIHGSINQAQKLGKGIKEHFGVEE